MDATPFGRYRLQELIGQGGMGQVYKAYDTVTDRIVALKVLPQQLSADNVFRERFRREAHTTASLSEPHVVHIYDYGEIDGHLFLVMPLIKGTDLQTLLTRNGPMAPSAAVSLIDQVATALDAAHAKGLVHRDIKPSNMLVAARDFTYLIDFGIARAAGESGLTSTGATIGTFAYMAPERFTGREVDARADIYALACVLHECLTGAQPYPGQSIEQQIAAHLSAPVPRPSEVRPGVPEAFDNVVARGMAKNPDDRYPSAGDLAAAARSAVGTGEGPIADTINRAALTASMPSASTSERGVAAPTIDNRGAGPRSAPPSGARAFNRKWIVLAAVLMVAGLLGGITYWRLAEGSGGADLRTPSATSSPPAADVPQLTATIPVGKYPKAVAIDAGSRTAYVANDGDNSVSVIDTTSRTLTATIPVGNGPQGVAVDPGSRTVYVTNTGDDTVSVIDPASRTVTATVPVGKGPVSVAVDAVAGVVYIANQGDNTVSVLQSISRTVSYSIGVGDRPGGVAFDPSTHTLYTNNYAANTVSVVDTIFRAVTTTVAVGSRPSGVSVDPGTHVVFVTNLNDGSVSVIDPARRAVTATIPVGKQPDRVVIDPSTHSAYITNYGDHSVSVIDTTGRTVTATIPVGKGPIGAALDPETHAVYITNQLDNTVSVIEP